MLKNDDNKLVVISSLQWLVQNRLVDIYGYVIMPNHIHLLWQQLKMNGKEFPKNSFEKFTAKSLVTKMKQQNDPELKKYEVRASILSKEMAEEKLDYVHYNPLQSHWNLCKITDEYRSSSAAFYLTGRDEFNLATNIMNAF